MGGVNRPPIFFLHKNKFLATKLKKDKWKTEIFSKRLFAWCKDREKMKNLRFMERGIEASESRFTKKKRHSKNFLCSLLKVNAYSGLVQTKLPVFLP